MVAYDRRWPDPAKRLSQETVDALSSALQAQRTVGREPLPELRVAVERAANEAQERVIPPETLLIQLKFLAEEAKLPPILGDEAHTALREWIVSACVAAYFRKPGSGSEERD